MQFHQFKFNPQITFFDFMDKIKSEEFGGKEEFDKIRAEYPAWVKELDLKSGVLGEEGYVYTKAEKKDIIIKRLISLYLFLDKIY